MPPLCRYPHLPEIRRRCHERPSSALPRAPPSFLRRPIRCKYTEHESRADWKWHIVRNPRPRARSFHEFPRYIRRWNNSAARSTFRRFFPPASHRISRSGPKYRDRRQKSSATPNPPYNPDPMRSNRKPRRGNSPFRPCRA